MSGFDEFIVQVEEVRILCGAIGANVWAIVPLTPLGVSQRVTGFATPEDAAAGALDLIRELRRSAPETSVHTGETK